MLTLSPTLLDAVLAVAEDAGQHLRDFYCQQVKVQIKADNTPVTEADQFVSRFLSERLRRLTPDIPILSEESCNIAFAERRQWQSYWLIDPLDGTQQFIDRTDQFAVMISLVQQHQPVLGVIHAPVLGHTFYAMQGFGAYKRTAPGTQRLHARRRQADAPLKIAIGPGRSQQKVRSILSENFACEFMVYASSGLKSTLVAEGICDCYVCLGNTGEWDTAAAEILLKEIDGAIFDSSFNALSYNQRESLINPHFVMVGQTQRDWRQIFQFKHKR